ncbi:GWxTD domain-containing protein [Aurantibacillus circumpalustris]|uniref:GWxTD domain-containing protein n=1 Tax=Aurantibacillus circumpalustris TaxID=3036359 RepID=UPI00295A7B3C|nr:GWxTD domain-containing protein [Aurantibacillus circumpalustris]
MNWFTLHKNLKSAVLLIFAVYLSGNLSAQVDAYYSSGVFNTPKNEPFIETYLTIVGKSLTAKRIEDKLQNSINVELKIFKDSVLVKVNKYNLLGPIFPSSQLAPSFIDNQRYSLPNGNYIIEISLQDNYEPARKPLLIKAPLKIDFNAVDLQSSSIQALESFKKSENESAITKSGYDLVPYTANYYPENNKQLAFYFEAYNTDKVLGVNKSFIFSYYLEINADRTILNNYGAFKKQTTAAVNPLLAKLDISKLASGNYNLVIQVKDEDNKLHLEKKYFFQRLNTTADKIERQRYNNEQSIAEYVGQCNNLDTLKMFVECLWPIANSYDKERIINQSLGKDGQIMKNFVVDFWERRAADTANPIKLWAAYYKEVQQTLILFKCGKQKGYYSDRGRVYLQYGAPSQRSQQNIENNTFPYEIWQYYRTSDAVNGQFFSNKKFVFVNNMLGDDCFKLIHSDMRGEINNPRWQFEVTRRNNNGLGDLDNTTPAGTEYNQFNEIYSNPR